MRKFIILTLFFLFYCSTIFSKSNYNFRQISIGEGLTQSTVNSLLFDSKGSLWIGTKSGLNRFAQHELATFLHNEDNKYSLPDNYIEFVGEDSEHNIWVSTRKGLVIYDSFKKEFNPIIRSTVLSYLAQKDGVLFGGEEMLYKYSYQDKNIKEIPFLVEKGSTPPIYYNIVKLIELDENKVLIGTRNMGVYVYDIDNNTFKHLINTNHRMLLSLYLSSDGLIYLSTFGQGVLCYDKEGALLAEYSATNSSLKNNIILDIVEKDDRLWMATDGSGISILDLKTKQFTEIQHIPGDKSTLPVNSITVLYKDVNDNLWAGSVRGGAFSLKETYIKTYTDVPLNNTSGLSEKAVISIYEDNSGLLWLGTDGGGINSFDPLTGKFTHHPSTYGDKVASIAGLSDTELLTSLYGKGMFIYNTKTKQSRPFSIMDEITTQKEFFTGFMPLGHKVADDKVYILSQNPWVYHITEKSFSKIKLQNQSIPSDGLILAYSNDSVSYVMRENQVFEIDQSKDSLHLLVSLDTKELISSVSYDDEKYIWIASNNGLTRYDPLNKEIKHIQTKLFHNISYLFLDKKRRLWISAQNMLFSYLLDEEKFVVWSEIDGFAPNEILFMHQTQSKYDYVYMGGTEGLVKIDEKITYDDMLSPYIQLDDIIFNGSSCINKIDNHTIEIPWNYNSLSVSTNLNEKDIFRKTMFKFLITGSREQTIESYSSSIRLPTLLPGKYSILVSHNTRDGSYTAAAKIIDIIIAPPWYNSAWFIFTAFLILVFLIVLTVRFFIWRNNNALRWEMKEYEQQVNEEKINFLVNISHELRTPLTLIYAPLKRLIDQSKDGVTNTFANQLHGIYKQARQMKDIINMVLDINRLNATEDHINKQNCRLNMWVRTIAEEFNNEWNDKRITVLFELNDQIGDVHLDEWKCQIVFSNFLMNALKFSESDTQITISTERKGEMVRIGVSDQGIGLQEKDLDKLFSRYYQGKHNKGGTGIGLSYSKALIEKHGGHIGAYNNKNKGATFYFEIPYTLDRNNIILPNNIATSYVEYPESVCSNFSCSEFTILIVEDEQDLRSFLEEIYKDNFKRVYTAKNGLKALEECKAKQPDIIISDVMMPEMDGYEFCRKLKLDIEISHIPVILLTARSDQESITLGYKQGADFYIAKPFEQDYLFTITSNLLRSREAIHQQYRKGSTPILPQESTISKRDEDFMTKLNLIINENISEPEFTIHQLVTEMNMSRASLYNKVKVITNLGVNEYINRIKIEKASYLLINSDISIKEIAFEVGFTYSRYFSTTFKEIEGMTPTEFREKKSVHLTNKKVSEKS